MQLNGWGFSYSNSNLLFNYRFYKMPCCCKDNVQASFVIGIVLAILSLIGSVDTQPLNIALGVVGALIHCILIFGAYKRHRTAILGRFKTFLFPLFFLYLFGKSQGNCFCLYIYCLSVPFLLSFLLPSCCHSIAFH